MECISLKNLEEFEIQRVSPTYGNEGIMEEFSVQFEES